MGRRRRAQNTGRMSVPQATAVPFRFLDLPPEMRNRIYEAVVISARPLHIPSACYHGKEASAVEPAITRVNKQLRRESLGMFYSMNAFEYHIHRCDFGYFLAWMDDIGLNNRSQIRDVTLVLKDSWTCGEGLIDFVRWCAKSEGTKMMLIDIEGMTAWNHEHLDILLEEDPHLEAKLDDGLDLADYDLMFGETYDALDGAIDLAERIHAQKSRSEKHRPRPAEEGAALCCTTNVLSSSSCSVLLLACCSCAQ